MAAVYVVVAAVVVVVLAMSAMNVCLSCCVLQLFEGRETQLPSDSDQLTRVAPVLLPSPLLPSFLYQWIQPLLEGARPLSKPR